MYSPTTIWNTNFFPVLLNSVPIKIPICYFILCSCICFFFFLWYLILREHVQIFTFQKYVLFKCKYWLHYVIKLWKIWYIYIGTFPKFKIFSFASINQLISNGFLHWIRRRRWLSFKHTNIQISRDYKYIHIYHIHTCFCVLLIYLMG